MRNGNNKCTLCPSGFFGKNPYTMRSVMIKDFYTLTFVAPEKQVVHQKNTDHRF